MSSTPVCQKAVYILQKETKNGLLRYRNQCTLSARSAIFEFVFLCRSTGWTRWRNRSVCWFCARKWAVKHQPCVDEESSNHDIFAPVGMEAKSKIYRERLPPGALSHIFFRALQVGPSHGVASREVEVKEGLVGTDLILIERKNGDTRIWRGIDFILKMPDCGSYIFVPIQPAPHSTLL